MSAFQPEGLTPAEQEAQLLARQLLAQLDELLAQPPEAAVQAPLRQALLQRAREFEQALLAAYPEPRSPEVVPGPPEEPEAAGS